VRDFVAHICGSREGMSCVALACCSLLPTVRFARRRLGRSTTTIWLLHPHRNDYKHGARVLDDSNHCGMCPSATTSPTTLHNNKTMCMMYQVRSEKGHTMDLDACPADPGTCCENLAPPLCKLGIPSAELGCYIGTQTDNGNPTYVPVIVPLPKMSSDFHSRDPAQPPYRGNEAYFVYETRTWATNPYAVLYSQWGRARVNAMQNDAVMPSSLGPRHVSPTPSAVQRLFSPWLPEPTPALSASWATSWQ
jgi:hypothetical protein